MNAALDDATRNDVIAEMRKWRFDNMRSAIVHLAYAVPEGKRFTDHDCTMVLDTLECDTLMVSNKVEELRLNGVLLRKFDASLSTLVYYMERRARETYSNDLKKHERHPEPEKRDVSEQLKELAAEVTDAQEASFLEEKLKT